jgi:hypothetical protein
VGLFNGVLSLSFYHVLFLKKVGFGRDGIINFHKHDQWTEDNPNVVFQSRRQQQNVLAGIVGNSLVGPYVFPHQLTGDHY